jgi:hypothetical protein
VLISANAIITSIIPLIASSRALHSQRRGSRNVMSLGETLANHAYDAAMQGTKPNDYGDTWVLPKDELAARRAEKTQPRGLSPQQIRRLLKAADERKRTP